MKRKTAMLFSLLSVLCWAVSPTLIRLVKDWFSVGFQNFFRYSLSLIILWTFTAVSLRKTSLRSRFAQMKNHVPSLILTAIFNFTHQYFLIAGVFLLFPGITAILEESTLLFSFLLSYLFIPSERYFIRDRVLRTGIIITLAGLAFTLIPEVLSAGSSAAASGNSARGVVYILISSASWALFTFMIKTRVPPVESYFATSFLFTIVVPLFVITMLFEGGGRIIIPDAPFSAWAVLAVSSLVGIGLAYSFYYTSIKEVGIMFSSTIGLLIPVIASIVSFFLFDERLSMIQIAGSVVLLSGCLIIVRREAGLSQESRKSVTDG